ncbi:DotU family type VI secretion system protein [Lampropedia aestuarii]|uniref:DotU family type VI secretion system protein n=1 Tax=Lampropedia aestuarii TaxID=2562762 RepID=A0A4S5BG96_9BURK|nr:DotU family type VI secretion system protein [Lampropedia aestuarii]MDH5857388.1 DotU family type VI secretion system protein [Lampropedia aestuarii]THJ31069.1 DotU family type VI secretion system protein [Lampropedia aestuarii]
MQQDNYARRGQQQPGSSPNAAAHSTNPLVKAAARLINLMLQIREIMHLPDPSALRKKLLVEVKEFERLAAEYGASHEEIVGARYCLCTALDETAAQTPWGSRGVWAKHSLLVTFHNETWGGEKYYQLLGRLAQNPERHIHLIELLYYLNALGFEGRFRIVDDGYSQLEILKRRIAAILHRVNGGYEARLSPHWQGVQSAAPTWRMVPPWVVACLCAFIAACIYVWFLFSLGDRSDVTYARLAGLQIPATQAAAYVNPPVAPRLRRFLEPEIKAGLLEVNDMLDRSVVTLNGDGLFDSGRVEVKQQYLPVLGRIAAALTEVDGEVVVTGFTDNVPIRSVRFASNWDLSQTRAESVKKILDGYLGQFSSGRVRFEGRGEADPIGDNSTPEGRSRNRRVEITVLMSAEEIHRQLNQNAAQAPAIPTGAAPRRAP